MPSFFFLIMISLKWQDEGHQMYWNLMQVPSNPTELHICLYRSFHKYVFLCDGVALRIAFLYEQVELKAG